MRRFNVLHVIGDMNIGGAERQLLEVIPRLNLNRYNVIVCCLRVAGDFGSILREKGIKIFELHKKSGPDFTVLPRLVRLIKEENIHIVQTYIFTSNFWGGIAAKIARVPIIFLGIRGLGVDAPNYEFLYLKMFSRFVDAIIFNSFAARDYYTSRTHIPANIFKVFHNGISISQYECNCGVEFIKRKVGIGSNKIVCTVGRLTEAKGHVYLLKAFKEVLKKYGNVKLLIVGDGELKRRLELLSEQLDIENNVVFLGKRTDVADLLQISDIFVLSSLHESFPNAVMEAMACGKPVVATKVGGIPELVIDHQTGLLVPPLNPHLLANSITELLLNESQAVTLGTNGKKRIEELFNFDILINKIEALYETTIQKKLAQGKISSS